MHQSLSRKRECLRQKRSCLSEKQARSEKNQMVNQKQRCLPQNRSAWVEEEMGSFSLRVKEIQWQSYIKGGCEEAGYGLCLDNINDVRTPWYVKQFNTQRNLMGSGHLARIMHGTVWTLKDRKFLVHLLLEPLVIQRGHKPFISKQILHGRVLERSNGKLGA